MGSLIRIFYTSLFVCRPASLDYVVSQILPDIVAKCPDTQAPWVLLGMKKDRRTDARARSRRPLVSPERAEQVGNQHGAALVMECSSRQEATGSWRTRKASRFFACLSCVRLSVCLFASVCPCVHVVFVCLGDYETPHVNLCLSAHSSIYPLVGACACVHIYFCLVDSLAHCETPGQV